MRETARCKHTYSGPSTVHRTSTASRPRLISIKSTCNIWVEKTSRNSFYGAFWWRPYFEWPRSLCWKVMIGRFWGADAIGTYGRAYWLLTIPTENVNSSVGEVAFSALSRLQDDPIRLKNYFLKGLSLVLGLTLPVTMQRCAKRFHTARLTCRD
jgi:hypothetical protein